jgi:ketosteroid isomerase-like protein
MPRRRLRALQQNGGSKAADFIHSKGGIVNANSTTARSSRISRRKVAYIALVFVSFVTNAASAAPEDEVRATLERFVAAQNAHDVKALESLLLNSPDFLWITRGTPVWGADAALKRFSALYEGTWRLDVEASTLKITMLGDRAAQIYVPIMFTIGAPGQSAQSTRFLMNQVLVKTLDGWKVSSILPIPAPAQ